MRDRIRPAHRHDDLLNKLSREDRIFVTREKAMMFAAALGYRMDPDSDIQAPDKYGEGIPLSIFHRATDDAFIDALAVAKVGDLNILQSNKGDDRLEIFEHFAALGLDQVDKSCYAQGREPLDGILELMDRYSRPETDDDSLPGLDQDLGDLGKLM